MIFHCIPSRPVIYYEPREHWFVGTNDLCLHEYDVYAGICIMYKAIMYVYRCVVTVILDSCSINTLLYADDQINIEKVKMRDKGLFIP